MNPVHHARTKHINIRHHFIRDQVDKKIHLEYLATNEMVSDTLTKPLPAPAFKYHRDKRAAMGMRAPPAAPKGLPPLPPPNSPYGSYGTSSGELEGSQLGLFESDSNSVFIVLRVRVRLPFRPLLRGHIWFRRGSARAPEEELPHCHLPLPLRLVPSSFLERLPSPWPPHL
ncbi:hypothetical protein PhCBS80983_g03284 [Powellomyces hirtus]|uniref:Uncharacterized protein n=1 Tax=Powellomyces hirtus TaxID=109895 RepID=A0A507E577_9FUNG|nr:hypothetical protein PhCBS80983_g03284 [Powellomyces hirtus]